MKILDSKLDETEFQITFSTDVLETYYSSGNAEGINVAPVVQTVFSSPLVYFPSGQYRMVSGKLYRYVQGEPIPVQTESKNVG